MPVFIFRKRCLHLVGSWWRSIIRSTAGRLYRISRACGCASRLKQGWLDSASFWVGSTCCGSQLAWDVPSLTRCSRRLPGPGLSHGLHSLSRASAWTRWRCRISGSQWHWCRRYVPADTVHPADTDYPEVTEHPMDDEFSYTSQRYRMVEDQIFGRDIRDSAGAGCPAEVYPVTGLCLNATGTWLIRMARC